LPFKFNLRHYTKIDLRDVIKMHNERSAHQQANAGNAGAVVAVENELRRVAVKFEGAQWFEGYVVGLYKQV
jgi:hypothetical protein